jgi:glycosyltransferase involved in cell wall biosynthesis
MSHKLAYLCSSESWGGLEMNQLKNACWMQNRGHSVVAVSVENTPFYEACQKNNLEVLCIQRHRKYLDIGKAKQLAKLIQAHAITHLILRDNRDISVAVLAKRMSKHKVHLSYFMEMQLGVRKTSLFHSLRYRYIDTWSCPLFWLKEQVETMTRMNKSRIIVIPSGVELEQFQLLPSEANARETLNLKSDHLVIGLIGRFDPHKGQMVLIEALNQLREQPIDVCFLGEPTRGEGSSYLTQMNEAIMRFELNDRVHFRPFRNDIGTFYAAMDAIVMATNAETVGMVTIEALACGKPIIATNSGGSPEILEFGKLGKLVEPNNARRLADAILEFVSKEWMPVSNELQERAFFFNHHRVCESVEKALNLKKV